MTRLCTSRVAENNKNVKLWYSNRVSETPTRTSYGEEIYEYDTAKCIEVSLLPLDTEVEARAYGVSFLGGKKAVITVEQGKLFNEFTHVWIDEIPTNTQESDYVVKKLIETLTVTVLVIDLKDGHNGR